MQQFLDSVVSLIIKTSTDLPPDVRAAMKHAVAAEDTASRAGQALSIIGQNIDQAAAIEGAICQDTGMPTFEIKTPVGANQIWMKRQIKDAIAEGLHPYGMITFDQSLASLVKQRLVTYEEAVKHSTSPSDFALLFRGVSGTSSGWSDKTAESKGAGNDDFEIEHFEK